MTVCARGRILFVVAAVLLLLGGGAAQGMAGALSPEWVVRLPVVRDAGQILVVAGTEATAALVSLHERDGQGIWRQLMTTWGYIGREGLGKAAEGDGRTPVGVFRFDKAFGIAPDPGCRLPYQQVDGHIYWSSDMRPGMEYNRMVDIRALPDLDTACSERIMDYPVRYQYCLNINYNAAAVLGRGSAIFLHCAKEGAPYTLGCVAIPTEKMIYVLRHVKPDCAVVIDSLENLGGAL